MPLEKANRRSFQRSINRVPSLIAEGAPPGLRELITRGKTVDQPNWS